MHKPLILALALSLPLPAAADDHVWGHVEFSKQRPDGPLIMTITKALTASPEYMEDGVLAKHKDDTTLYLGVLVPYPQKALQAWFAYAGTDRLYCSYDPGQAIPYVQSVAYKATQCLAEGANLELFLVIEGWGFD